METQPEENFAGWPKSLVDSYLLARARGMYKGGSIAEFANVRYMLFRVSAADDGRLPPSKARWLESLRKYDEICGKGGES